VPQTKTADTEQRSLQKQPRAHDACERKWAAQTTRDIPKGVEKKK